MEGPVGIPQRGAVVPVVRDDHALQRLRLRRGRAIAQVQLWGEGGG